MSDLIQLEPAELESTVGTLIGLTNGQVIDACVQTANALNDLRGNEPIIDSCYEGLKEFQKQYNIARDGVESVIQNFKDTCDVAEYLSKQSANMVQARSTNIDVKRVDSSKVMV